MPQYSLYQEEFYPSPWQQTWQEFKSSHVAVVGFFCLMFFTVLAVFGPLLMPYDPQTQFTNSLLLPPAWNANSHIAHLFGTDGLGRDLLTRVIHGCRTTFGVSLLLVIVAMLVGVSIGAVAGMSKGIRSSILNHLLDSLMAVPTLLIAIIIVAILGVGLVNSMWAIALALIPQFVHNTRDFVRAEMTKGYVLAVKLDGARGYRIFLFSILPNMIEPLVVQFTLSFSAALLDISALGFLNLGAQASTPELGAMLFATLDVAYIAPWNVALPGLALFLLVLSVNIVGDGLRTALRNRLRH